MLATVAQRYPRGGAWTVGLMGVAGAISNYFVLPALGKIYDNATAKAAAGLPLSALSHHQLAAIQAYALLESFRALTVLPIILVVAFATLWFLDRTRT